MKFEIAAIVAAFKKPGEIEQRRLIAKIRHHPQGFALMESLVVKSPPPDVLRWVATALGEFQNAKAKVRLKSLLRHNAMSVRLHAIRAISKWPGADITKAMKPLIHDESGGIRLNALEILNRRGYAKTKSLCKAMLKDPKWYIRKKAQEILTQGENKESGMARPLKSKRSRN